MAFGVVTALLGLLDVLTGIVVGVMNSPRAGGRALLDGAVSIVLGAVYIVAGVGLWALRPWAWWLAVLVGIVGFVLAIGSALWMILWAAIVVYLVLVRNSFGVLRNVPKLVQA
jgi:lysylphosphatidylglycerol synthetase-like protein (DUF2156 family)